jgi:hypothetical protein
MMVIIAKDLLQYIKQSVKITIPLSSNSQQTPDTRPDAENGQQQRRHTICK